MDKLKKWLGVLKAIACWYRSVQCKRGNHSWFRFTIASPGRVYFLRRCEFCRLHERKSAGPMGDQKWRPINSPFAFRWEEEDFCKAMILPLIIGNKGETCEMKNEGKVMSALDILMEEKKVLEGEIIQSIHESVKKFRSKTGLEPCSIDVRMIETTCCEDVERRFSTDSVCVSFAAFR